MLDHTNTPAIVRGTPLLPGEGRGLDAGGPAPDQGAPLGNMRNFGPSAPQADFQARWNFDQSFSSVQDLELAQQRYTRLRRFALQAAAVAALPGEKRLWACLRVPHAEQVTIKHSPARAAAWYCGLVTCGSVWMCPICAAKVSERRRQELGRAIKAWKAKGGAVWLVTLTFSHQRYDRLRELTRQLAAAMHRLHSGRTWAQLREDFGHVGQVRALEVTHGGNGWHPHIHQLYFVEGPDTKARRDELRSRLFERWVRACELSGLGLPSERHGVTVQGGDKAGAYVTKWGLEAELTKHVVKDGRSKSRTPMGILADFFEAGDQADADLYGEYVRAMKGAKQLVWSRGLRQLLDLGDELTDADVAKADEAQVGDGILTALSLAVWRLVAKWDVRGQLIGVASKGDPDLVAEYIEGLIALEDNRR